MTPEDYLRVEAAVRLELDRRARMCREEHAQIAVDVVKRLRAQEAVSAVASLPLGPAVYLRQLAHLDPATAARWLKWVAVPVSYHGRPTNRRVEWFERFRAEGGEICAWSWFASHPETVERDVDFAASIDARWFMINAEKELRGEPGLARRIAVAGRRRCDVHGMALGLSSYSRADTVRDFPWREFAPYCDFGSPQIYDRRGSYDPDYPRSCVESWIAEGFNEIVPGCGLHVRRQPSGWRWRRAPEISRHLGLFPRPLHTAVGWTIGKVPESSLIALAGAVQGSR